MQYIKKQAKKPVVIKGEMILLDSLTPCLIISHFYFELCRRLNLALAWFHIIMSIQKALRLYPSGRTPGYTPSWPSATIPLSPCSQTVFLQEAIVNSLILCSEMILYLLMQHLQFLTPLLSLTFNGWPCILLSWANSGSQKKLPKVPASRTYLWPASVPVYTLTINCLCSVCSQPLCLCTGSHPFKDTFQSLSSLTHHQLFPLIWVIPICI